ncbi:MAG: ferritin [Chlorobiaceae bacterium]|nr:ferritin [Chlorobiaceae bacterium]NTV60954.1 ferritin [Chlorobiaceae bacterium]
MLSKKLQKAFNDQINHEFSSSYLYLSMAAYALSQNLPGFAHWLKMQTAEEKGHAMKLYNYVAERGGRIELQALEQPPVEFSSPIALFEEVLKHERKITAFINKLYEAALDERDYASQVVLHWFIQEQVEEEAAASEILETLKMAGEKGHALIMMDRQLARRGQN